MIIHQGEEMDKFIQQHSLSGSIMISIMQTTIGVWMGVIEITVATLTGIRLWSIHTDNWNKPLTNFKVLEHRKTFYLYVRCW